MKSADMITAATPCSTIGGQTSRTGTSASSMSVATKATELRSGMGMRAAGMAARGCSHALAMAVTPASPAQAGLGGLRRHLAGPGHSGQECDELVELEGLAHVRGRPADAATRIPEGAQHHDGGARARQPTVAPRERLSV